MEQDPKDTILDLTRRLSQAENLKEQANAKASRAEARRHQLLMFLQRERELLKSSGTKRAKQMLSRFNEFLGKK
jgi:hypothetical protein